MPNHQRHCDIFCKVIDNLGDAGVCWRLARQLHAEHGWRIRLFIDQPDTLTRLAPDTQPDDSFQIRPWHHADDVASAPEVVIEAFGCALPETYVQRVARAVSAPPVINLEYLSAEAWVAGCHRLPSPGATAGLRKWFFFPGFTHDTGGLLRETDYTVRRQAFRDDAFRAEFGLGPRPHCVVSMFCYPQAPLDTLFVQLDATDNDIEVLLPGGLMSHEQRGKLRIRPLPFLPQARYDELLWASDLNFVRGEDSFVRAQLAGKPFVWQAYRQEDNAHQTKLHAFLSVFWDAESARQPNYSRGDTARGGCASRASAQVRDLPPGPLSGKGGDHGAPVGYAASAGYGGELPPNFSGGDTAPICTSGDIAAIDAFWAAWNGDGHLDWPAFAVALPTLQAQAARWRGELMAQSSLSERLVAFVESIVE